MDLLEFTMELDIKIFFELGKYLAIFNRIRYLIGVKSGITYVISRNSNSIYFS